MEMLRNITIVFLLIIVLPASVVTAGSVNVLLQEGIYAEEVDGDLDTAIRKYEQIIQNSSAQKFQIAQALYRQGMCYLKKKNEQRARLIFAKLIEDYSDQEKIADKIRPMLEELSDADPAALMPSGTLMYVELGSLGKQIETILNMLKGTPFENPFEVINGGRSRHPGGKNSSNNILAAFMNPSMMAEFKKIRGMAVGVTGISLNNPPMIVVLYPGKSEAFRSMILAMVGMVAQPGEAIEGMSTLKIKDVAGVAYDEDVIIIAQPLKQLNWSVRQYKGLSNGPTLSSGNKSFLKISKTVRRENALTIWSNTDEAFKGVMKVLPKDEIPEKIRIIDRIVNIENIDDFVASLSIKENRIALEANTVFKDGRRCLAYNLIRTPEIKKAGLEAVPSEAVGLLSIVLGGVDDAQAKTLTKKIEDITGLDITREIFANIEQVTLFVMPVDNASSRNNTGLHPIVDCIGLAINSHNPQHTYNVLNEFLSVVSLMTNRSETEQSEQGIKEYKIGFINGQSCYCYIDRINKTTVLSLNSEIVEKSVSAIKNHRSIFTTGPLMKAANNLSETTNKLVLINVGGAIRHIDSHIKVTCDNPRNPAHKILAQLAQACDETSFQYRTNEKINGLNEYYDIDPLPPMGKVLPLLMQLSMIDPTAKTKATRPTPGNESKIGITALSRLKWEPGVNSKSHKVYFGNEIDGMTLLAEVHNANEIELPELQESVKYYWRVDEIWDDGTVITGDVWSFSAGKLVCWWKFDENSGSVAGDSSGNGNNGTLEGDVTWQPDAGKFGGAVKFDGISSYVEIPTAGMSASMGTVSLWVKLSPQQNEPEHRYIFGHTTTPYYSNRIQLYMDEGLTKLDLGLCDSHDVNTDMAALKIDTWYQIILTWNEGKYVVYLNGKELAAGSYNNLEGLSDIADIGNNGRPDSRNQSFNGLIDDVRIYNYALPEKEVEALYDKSK
ncbi:MAG: tetratricopeptide repeat protein [Phycisphaerales bacterium]|jgi:hypothetical protein